MSLVKLKNPILKKIINVYQPRYKNIVAQGLGDFLRGCFCLYQICKIKQAVCAVFSMRAPVHVQMSTFKTLTYISKFRQFTITFIKHT
jgi:hypothetical protein